MRRTLKRVQPWFPWLVMGAAIAIFASDFLFFGKVFLPMDVLHIFRPWSELGHSTVPVQNLLIADVADNWYPLLRFLSEELAKGNLPLWNPNVFLGLPVMMFSMMNVVFNPLFLPFLWLFPPETAQGLIMVLNLTLLAGGSFLFFRQRGLSELPALFGSLIFTFNGVLMVWLEFMSADFAYASTALSLYAYERSLAESRLRFALLNGLVIGILLLGGAVQWVFFLIPLLGSYALARVLECWSPGSTVMGNLRPLWRYVGPLAGGVLIALPSLWHFAEYMPLSHRVHESFAALNARTGTFYPELLATFLFPNLFGYQPNGVYFARGSATVVYQNYVETMVYMGVATLVLSFFAFRLPTRRWMATWGLAVILLALLVAAKIPVVYHLMYQYVPGFNGMQPSRIFILLPPAFACLAALGLESLVRRPPGAPTGRRVALSLGIAIVACIVGLALTHAYYVRTPTMIRHLSLADHFSLANPDFFVPLSLLAAVATGLWLHASGKLPGYGLSLALITILVVDLIPFGLRLNTRVDRSLIYPRTTGLTFLMNDQELFRTLPIGFTYDTLMAFGIETVGGYAAMFPASFLDLLSAMERDRDPNVRLGVEHQNLIVPTNAASKLLPMLNTKYLVLPRTVNIGEPLKGRYVERHRSDLAVFEATRYLPRAYVVYQYLQVKDQQDAISVMFRSDFDPFRAVVGTYPLPDVEPLTRTPSPSPPLVTTARPTSDRFELDVTMDRPGVLVVSEQFFPGWEAFVDGTPADVFAVNSVLLGVNLSGGRHHVTVRFFPRSLKWGLVSTGVALAGVFVGLLIDRREARRAASIQRPDHLGPAA